MYANIEIKSRQASNVETDHRNFSVSIKQDLILKSIYKRHLEMILLPLRVYGVHIKQFRLTWYTCSNLVWCIMMV